MEKIRYENSDEWEKEGIRRFGSDQQKWQFVCPSCGFVASVADYVSAGASDGFIGFSCIGRLVGAKRSLFEDGPGPCDYAGGGLFNISPVSIGGFKGGFFAFADVEVEEG